MPPVYVPRRSAKRSQGQHEVRRARATELRQYRKRIFCDAGEPRMR
jgi:hypothetical protein